jgi:ABC-type glycerol-3-phosphate transport system substrate-binding protein
MKRKNRKTIRKLTLFFAVVVLVGCTTKKEREPGPLVAHFIDDPESRVIIGLLTDQFIEIYRIPVEIEFVDETDLRFNIIEQYDDLEEKVDVIELDLYYLEDAQEKMSDVSKVIRDPNSSGKFYFGPLEAGKFDEEYKFVPFRLSWPLMMISPDNKREVTSFQKLLSINPDNLETVVFPSLKEKEFFQVIFSIIKEYGGDPKNLDDPNVYEAFSFMSQLGPQINPGSKVFSAGDSLKFSDYDTPAVFFEWPYAVIEMSINGKIPREIEAKPLPCQGTSNGGTFAHGRYLGILKDARHKKDAIKYLQFITSSTSQSELLYGSPWLPSKNTGWGNINTARQQAYSAYIQSCFCLARPPRNIRKVESALTSAAWQVMYEGKDPKKALQESKSLLK